MKTFLDNAISLGFTIAVLLKDINIQCEERIRDYCNPKQCPNYGNNWVCPPGSGTILECAEKISGYKNGLLLQSISKLTPPADAEEYRRLNRLHNERLRELILLMEKDKMNTLALTSGGCIFCETCSYPEPCIKPSIRMHSLSAYGIDVGKLLNIANLEFAFKPDRVQYVALVMYA